MRTSTTAAKKGGTPPASPEGFGEWLTAFNAALNLKFGYRPTSASGRRLATQYAKVLAEGRFSPADLLAAIPGAVRKTARLESARRPTWLLANVEECLEEAARPVAGNGREGRRTHVEPEGFCHSPTPYR